jgi:hypothetical protein
MLPLGPPVALYLDQAWSILVRQPGSQGLDRVQTVSIPPDGGSMRNALALSDNVGRLILSGDRVRLEAELLPQEARGSNQRTVGSLYLS